MQKATMTLTTTLAIDNKTWLQVLLFVIVLGKLKARHASQNTLQYIHQSIIGKYKQWESYVRIIRIYYIQ